MIGIPMNAIDSNNDILIIACHAFRIMSANINNFSIFERLTMKTYDSTGGRHLSQPDVFEKPGRLSIL